MAAADDVLHIVNWRRRLGGGETQPEVFECSDGADWVVKFPGNPHLGAAGLCADWIGTVLAGLAGVSVVDCRIVKCDAPALSTMPRSSPAHRWARPGHAFASRYIDSLDVTGLQAILDCATPAELARIAVTDTWLDVLDRKKPQQGQWNLLIDTTNGDRRLVSIDYGLALTEVLGPPLLEKTGPVSRIPHGWQPYLHREAIEDALTAISNIDVGAIEDIMRAVPSDWRTHVRHFEDVGSYLQGRRLALPGLFP